LTDAALNILQQCCAGIWLYKVRVYEVSYPGAFGPEPPLATSPSNGRFQPKLDIHSRTGRESWAC